MKVFPGTERSHTLIQRIQEHVKGKLAAHEYPREIKFIDEFPMTVTGKVRRRELREAEERKRAERVASSQKRHKETRSRSRDRTRGRMAP